MALLKKVMRNIDDHITIICLAGIILLTGANVILRYFFSKPIPWTEEITLFLFVWLIFIGMATAMKKDTHIGVDFIVEKLSPNLRKMADIFRMAVMYIVIVYLLIYLAVIFMSNVTGKVTPILGISYQYINISVIIGAVLTFFHFTLRNIQDVKKWRDKEWQ